MSCLQTIRVITDRDNTAGLVFGMVAAGGTAELYDFTAATRMTLTITVDGVATVMDSDVDPTLIDWSAGEGEVSFALGHEGIPVGTYQAQLVVYSALYPSGYLMDVGESGYSFNLVVV